MATKKPSVLVCYVLTQVALALFLGSCGDSSVTPSPKVVISGAVALIESVSNDGCEPVGERRLAAVDSAAVYLIERDSKIATAYTTEGNYHFTGVPAGQYRVAVGVWPCLADTTAEFQATADVAVPDTLILRRTGRVSNCPNPFMSSAKLDFGPGLEGLVTVSLASLSGTPRLVVDRTQGSPGIRYIVVWGVLAGDDGASIPSGDYLITVATGADSTHSTVQSFDVVCLQRSGGVLASGS